MSITEALTGKIIGGIIRLFKNNGNTRISEINENLISLIENPHIEKLLNK